MPIPPDYEQRAYAGVLGKIIGVYLGRPIEGWTYERIGAQLGEITGYVHDRLGVPLIVADDDISGTFTFIRALADSGCGRDITAEQIGRTWLNYIIEDRNVLWWGGMGNSTEHTAYLRLKAGVPAPHSGSVAMNGKVVAEQIGAQIFIDGWGMVAPGDPGLAADLARRAASVSHDGEAVFAAQVIAAMEALAFVDQDIDRLLSTAVRLIPSASLMYRLIADLREWHATEPDWHRTRARVAERYGYDRYGGNCHVVPNHALVILSLLYGAGDFAESLKIVNSCGWDTDCNSGNVGCLLGIRNGLAAFEAGTDWRGPVADRMYVPTADGGSGITDALTAAYGIVNAGRSLAGACPVVPKRGARFHFSLPGSVQGFRVADDARHPAATFVENRPRYERGRCLAIGYRLTGPGDVARVASPTFLAPSELETTGYGVTVCPTIYSGQTARAVVTSGKRAGRVDCALYISEYDEADALERRYAPAQPVIPGEATELRWRIPDTAGQPIADIGLEVTADGAAEGVLYLDYLTWDGAPDVTLTRPPGGTAWARAWVPGLDRFTVADEPFRLVHNRGRGLLIQGTREWGDYRVSAGVCPHMAAAAGIAARVQGMSRYYAFLLIRPGRARLIRMFDEEAVLAETAYDWRFGETYDMTLDVNGSRVRAFLAGRLLFDMVDPSPNLAGGAIALVCDEGRVAVDVVRVRPSDGQD